MVLSVTTTSVTIDTHKKPITVEVLESRYGLVDALVNGKRETIPSSAEEAARETNNRQLFIMFTGNPGMVQFYTEMSYYLVKYAREGRIGVVSSASASTSTSSSQVPAASSSSSAVVDLDVLVIGYAGHSFEELNDEDQQIFGLPDQEAISCGIVVDKLLKGIYEKRQRKTVPFGETKDDESAGVGQLQSSSFCPSAYKHIYLGGHSIGGYMATVVADKALEHDPEQLIRRAFLLAPTLCHMRESPEGRAKAPVVNSPLKMELAACFTGLARVVLPKKMVKWLICKGEPRCAGQANAEAASAEAAASFDSTAAETVFHVMRPNVLRNVLFMAKTELELVFDLNTQRLERIRHLVVAWFPKEDRWSPLANYRLIASALGLSAAEGQIFSNEAIFADKTACLGDGQSPSNASSPVTSEGGVSSASSSPAASPASPVCAIDCSDDFIHAWCLNYNETVVRRMILPYCTV